MRYAARHRKPARVPSASAVISVAAIGIVALQASGASAHQAIPSRLSAVASTAGQLRSGMRLHVAIRGAMTAALAYWKVRPGDTLSALAQRLFGSSALWPRFYAANRNVVGPDPNIIVVGELLKEELASHGDYGHSFGGSAPVLVAATTAEVQPPVTVTGALSGTLNCADLETLWDDAGGAHVEAFLAAEIAMAESGGNQWATGLAGERGYWQINPDHGSLSTYDPMGNARAAVVISADGTNWTPWTTYTSGAYAGRC